MRLPVTLKKTCDFAKYLGRWEKYREMRMIKFGDYYIKMHYSICYYMYIIYSIYDVYIIYIVCNPLYINILQINFSL